MTFVEFKGLNINMYSRVKSKYPPRKLWYTTETVRHRIQSSKKVFKLKYAIISFVLLKRSLFPPPLDWFH